MSIGISIYPLQSSLKSNKEYIEKCHNLGYKRVFTSLLEVDKDRNKALDQVEKYRVLLNMAKNFGMEVFVDINPKVLKIIGVDPTDFQFFSQLGATGLRLDGVFNGFYEAFMTYNSEDLVIEINGSFDTGYVNSILDLGAKKSKFVTCHNFYPEELTGLSIECFKSCHKRHADLGLKTAAFVTSQMGDSFGPWDINDGLCTIEDHRYLPIEVQAQELFALGIDDVIIGDAFASDEELKVLASIDPDIINLKVQLNNPEDYNFFDNKVLQNRWDYSNKIIRDVMSRSELKDIDIPFIESKKNTLDYGSIIVNNNNYKRYKGEILISIDQIKYDARRNFIGMIEDDYHVLLKYIIGGKRFSLDLK